jgi:hypothetical protein
MTPIHSFLTADELEAIQSLHTRTPYLIQGVCHTQFSIARHYAGVTYAGHSYVYIPPTDELIRADVLRFIQRRRKAKTKKAVAPTPSLLEQS